MSSRITRRQFLTTGGAALGVLSLPRAVHAQGSTTLISAQTTEATGLDPSLVPALSRSRRTPLMYNQLVRFEPDMTLVPELAESWQVSPDGLTWTFKLRQGVKFHDGQEFTSADVKFSFDRLLEKSQAGKSDFNAEKHKQKSQILVPLDTPGVKIVRMLPAFGYDDAPHGHAEVIYDNVRVPKSNILLGEGRGFEIAQGRLGPGRIHHCMRAIGVAERALEMAIKRAKSRVAFGQRISEMGVTKAHVADMRMEIDMARLLVLKAAWAMDKYGNKEARQQIAMIKVAVPNITSKVVDRCLQLHGAGGVSQVFKLASMYAHQRTLRLADGPDEVHRDQIGRLEIAKYN